MRVNGQLVAGSLRREALDGLDDLQAFRRPAVYGETTDQRIRAVLGKPPPKGFARWNGPLIAEGARRRRRAVRLALLPKQKIDLGGCKSWCESNDPRFSAKVTDAVGLYLAPPENAVVLCVDEKPSTQALERAQGYLKLPNGRNPTRHSHDYKRIGTTTLFAPSRWPPARSRVPARSAGARKEFLAFMNEIVAEYPNRKIEVMLHNRGLCIGK